MAPRIERRGRGWSLTRRLVVALSVGSLFVAVLLGFLGADRDMQRRAAARAESEQQAVMSLAERASPLLERKDLMRLSVLAAVGRDQVDGRVLILDAGGHVVIDTALVAGSRTKALRASAGVEQRVIERESGEAVRESSAAVRFGGEVIGELRLQRSLHGSEGLVASFDVTWFGLVLLSCLTLVAAAAMLGHYWSTRVRGATDALMRLAAGEVPSEAASAEVGGEDAELRDLNSVMRELERGLNDGLARVGETCVAMALQIVDGLEKRRLVPSGHGERTSRYAMRMAGKLNLLDGDQGELEIACRLVDLGKASLRESLLIPDGPLSGEDQRSFQSHPVRAAEQLESVRPLRRIGKILRHQLERYDGRGTPDGLRGDRLPLGSRILAIASAFDLLTASASEQALDWEQALAEIERRKGEVFDPWLVDVLVDEIRREPPVEDDREVAIVPAGAMPWSLVDGENDEDDVVSEGDLELLREDFPFEDPS
ncbi:MAG: HD-GYP domain-containing protein [Planctomycetota bacterium]